ncbi:hypothetical protein D3C79_951000 [compost metagenome]
MRSSGDKDEDSGITGIVAAGELVLGCSGVLEAVASLTLSSLNRIFFMPPKKPSDSLIK